MAEKKAELLPVIEAAAAFVFILTSAICHLSTSIVSFILSSLQTQIPLLSKSEDASFLAFCFHLKPVQNPRKPLSGKDQYSRQSNP